MTFSAASTWTKVKQLTHFPPNLDPYYIDILSQYEDCYNIGVRARSKGLDPKTIVESKTVLDLADRVNQLLGLEQFEGLAERLRELINTVGKERAALTISQEIALGKFGAMETSRALEYGVRTALAIITDGVTIAPVQGIYSVSVKRNDDNTNYASISYAGPMRSAGGTEAAFSLVIADITARKLGLSRYRAREEEVGRFVEELRIYEREIGNFQYQVSDDDIRLALENIPVEIDGVETDPVEVVVHRNLKRVGTNRLRGGALRVLNDGVIGRAHKLARKLELLNITGWEWLKELKGGTQQSTEETEHTGAHFDEVISGRAVLSFPRRKGGFRLRYGRSFNTGLSAVGIHPATAAILDYPIVVGTQVKVDLPGKAASVAFVDTIEGPTVLLSDGSVKRINSVDDAEYLKEKISRVIDLGDILISFGDFLENNKNLPPSPYVQEWWAQDLEDALKSTPNIEALVHSLGIPREKLEALIHEPLTTKINASEALRLCEVLGIPLHPSFTPRFDAISIEDVVELRGAANIRDGNVIFSITSHHIKRILQDLLIPYTERGSEVIVEGEVALVLTRLLRVGEEIKDTRPYKDAVDYVEAISGVKIGKQNATTVGVRVGRPEKAMLRRLKPPVHVLFPVGNAGGPTRDVLVASKRGNIEVELANIICPKCNRRCFAARCGQCGETTEWFLSCPKCGRITRSPVCTNCKVSTTTYSATRLDLTETLRSSGFEIIPNNIKTIKGVKGLTSQSKVPELLYKGVLRSKHQTYVYKDGTIRIDVTNAPLTHFRPADISSDISTLLNLGYRIDFKGVPLTDSSQIVELRPQDVIIPTSIADDLLRVAQFIDEELTSIYGLEPYYKARKPEDLIGKLVVGLAPHTSVGVVGRIIGFSPAQVCFAHPYWHAAKRRDCDGDGDSLLLLLDIFLNFSYEFIPAQIGGLMDTPLLIQPVVIPSEVDEQAHNLDVAKQYPREFYEKTKAYPNPSILSALVERVTQRLGNENQFYDFGFTHTTSAITVKRARSAYSTLKTLAEKIAKQIEVADKVEAVSTKEVVESIIKTHLIRDIMGNIKKYTGQAFKCRKCGTTYRRPTLFRSCPACGGELRETLTRASVEKYLPLVRKLADDYNIDQYLKNRIEMVERELYQLFGNDKKTQLELTDFG